MKPTGRIEPLPWMTAPETAAVVGVLTATGEPARFVGGCVRDALLGRSVKDVDLATPLPPAAFEACWAAERGPPPPSRAAAPRPSTT